MFNSLANIWSITVCKGLEKPPSTLTVYTFTLSKTAEMEAEVEDGDQMIILNTVTFNNTVQFC